MTVGFLVVTYNDLDLSLKMYDSLLKSLSDDPTTKYGYTLAVVDAGSEDDSVKYWRGKAPVICKENPDLCYWAGVDPTNLIHLSVCLNVGTEFLLRNRSVDYVCWIHPDCTFINSTWCYELVSFIKHNPWTGKAASDDIHQIQQTRFPANQQPHMISRRCVEDMIVKDGYLYDEKFIGIGGWEDLDLCRRQLLYGYVPVIVGSSVVEHPSMKSRERHDTTKEGYHNASVFCNKWQVPNADFAYGIENFWDGLDWQYDDK